MSPFKFPIRVLLPPVHTPLYSSVASAAATKPAADLSLAAGYSFPFPSCEKINYSNKHTTLYDFMEGSAIFDGNKEEVVEEEHVLIDLDDVFGQVHIPPNAPYVLSGLDTPNPILVIDENIKLIGEYEETIGTCLVFKETDETTVVHEETGPSEANLFQGRCIVENKQHPTKEIQPVTSLHKILRFRLFTETDSQDSSDKQMEDDSNL